MTPVKPKILERDGKKEFVIFTYEEFLKIQEELEDYEDLKILRKAKEKEGKAATISLDDARKQLRIKSKS